MVYWRRHPGGILGRIQGDRVQEQRASFWIIKSRIEMWVDFWVNQSSPSNPLYTNCGWTLPFWTLSLLGTTRTSVVDQRNLLSGCRVDRYRLQTISGGMFTPLLHNIRQHYTTMHMFGRMIERTCMTPCHMLGTTFYMSEWSLIRYSRTPTSRNPHPHNPYFLAARKTKLTLKSTLRNP